ncbi:RIP metalloprotease RseP [Myxococcota bacterium]|nr:RIP metalloprotease RseP [Myxococcota bacterium]
MPEFLSTPLNALQMIVAFGAVIFIHELGHFIAAKRAGVRVLKFAIGFDFGGLKLFSRRVGETEYVVGAFPLGGYVRMLGQEDVPGEEPDAAGDVPPDSFQAKSVWQRMQIIGAGVMANFLSAFVFCYLALISGFQMTAPEVGSVGFDALQAGLRPGDRISALDGVAVESWQDVQVLYATAEPGGEIAAEVVRQGEAVEVRLPVQRDADLPFNAPDFTPASGLQIREVVTATPEGPTAAERAGVKPGDVIRAVDGRTVSTWEEFSRMARVRAGVPTRLQVDRPLDRRSSEFQPRELQLTPGRVPDEYTGPWLLGVEPAEPARIDAVVPGLPGDAAGLRAGDLVLSVGGIPVSTWRDFWLTAEYAPEGEPLAVEVRGPEGGTRTAQVVPGAADHWPGLGVWGVFGMGLAHRAPEGVEVGKVLPGSPAEMAGILPGDRVTAVKAIDPPASSGFSADKPVPVHSWSGLYATLARVPARAVDVSWVRGGEEKTRRVELAENPHARWRGFVGIGAGEKKAWVALGPVEAVSRAARQPFMMLQQLYVTLKALVLGRVGAETLSGPLGIGRAIWYAAEQSVGEVLNLVALISINLAVVNFLPIPITDGGHFLFLVYEKVKGRKVSDEIQSRLQWVGLIFLLLVFVFATWNDISHLLLRR